LFLILGKFIRHDPISVASALYLRRIELIPRENDNDLTPWEKKVYSFYRAFSGYRAKGNAKRVTLPSAIELALLPELQNIIIHPRDLKVVKKEEIDLAPQDRPQEPVYYEPL
jgi:hypothetical protein